jgi:hypothetical protein
VVDPVGNKDVASTVTTTITAVSSSTETSTTTGSPKRTGPHPTLGSNVIVGGNVAGIIGELSKRKNADGTSAATGLKHVRVGIVQWLFVCSTCIV